MEMKQGQRNQVTSWADDINVMPHIRWYSLLRRSKFRYSDFSGSNFGAHKSGTRSLAHFLARSLICPRSLAHLPACLLICTLVRSFACVTIWLTEAYNSMEEVESDYVSESDGCGSLNGEYYSSDDECQIVEAAGR